MWDRQTPVAVDPGQSLHPREFASRHLQHLYAGRGTAPATSSAVHPVRRGTLQPGTRIYGTW